MECPPAKKTGDDNVYEQEYSDASTCTTDTTITISTPASPCITNDK